MLALKEYFERQLALTPGDNDGVRELRKCEERLRGQRDQLDLASVRKVVSSTNPRVDVVDYISKVEIRESLGKGRGLFATEAIGFCEVTMYEKAFQLTFQHEEGTYVTYKYNARSDDLRVGNTSLWQNTVKQLTVNPSLMPKVASLHGMWKGTGREELVVDGKLIVDTFQIHEIVTRNAFGVSSPSDERHSYHSDQAAGAANSGLWIKASYSNHLCLFNAIRRSIGDLLVVHAARPIRKGEELNIAYSGDVAAYDERQHEMKMAEAQDSPDGRQKRAELDERVQAFRNKHTTGHALIVPPKTIVKEAEDLAHDLEATYVSRRHDGLPRKPLAAIQCWLISAYGSRRAKTYEMCCSVLRSVAFDVVDEPFSVNPTAISAVTDRAITTLKFLSAIKLRTGEKRVVRDMEDMAKTMLMMRFGSLEGLMDPAKMLV